MLAALSMRFGAVEALREDADLVVARAHERGQPVFLCYRSGLSGASGDANRVVAERLQAVGGFGAPISWHQGPAGVTWVVDADDGLFLDDWLATRPVVPLPQALPILLDLAQALDTLHRHGIVHLRVRPACVRIAGGAEPADAPSARLLAAEALLTEDAAQASPGEYQDLRYSAPELSGRTAARADARTDLYLLGLLAWRLLAGRQPFEAADALGWLHAHLAVQPPPLRSLRAEVPQPLAQLVQSLLAKSPADRPASARAVADDLQRCLDALLLPPHLQGVALSAGHARFQLPRALVGREAERNVLRDTLARAGQGAVEALALTGPSGIGKTALAAELEPDVLALGGLFAMAKSDQLGSARPFATLADLLEALGQQLLRAPRTVAALGPDGGVLAALSPQLAAALDLNTADSAVPSTLARQRLLAALVRLLAALGQEQPVVLVIDDVQWSDADSLALLAGALSDRAVRRVFLLMLERSDTGWTSRSDELARPLRPAILALRPLDEAGVGNWLALALPGGLQQPAAALERLAARSAGNPLFLGQLVKTMVLRGQLVPDAKGRWQLDERSSAWDALPESVLEAASRGVHALGQADAELLAYAARLGTRFDARLLASVTGRDQASIEDSLRAAQGELLVEAVSDGRGGPLWRFMHDRLQQAAYELAPAAAGLRLHLRIGRTLRNAAEPGQLFETCRHLNLAVHLMEPDELPGLLRLNHQAGRLARERAGFAQYAALMRSAIALLPHCAPGAQEHRALLHDAAEALVLERDFEAADACLREAEAMAGDPVEAAHGAELRIQWLVAQERTEEAFHAGLAALAAMGLRFQPDGAKARTLWELLRLKAVLRGRPPATWVNAAESHDPRHVQTQRLLFATVSVSHAHAPALYALLGLVGTRHALQQGCTPWSSQLMSVAAHVLSGVFNDVETGHALGELSLRLGERFGTSGLSFNHLYFVMHRKVSLTQTLPQMRQCFEQAERAGSFEIAGYAAGMYVGMTWNTQHSLQGLEEALHDVGAFSRRHRHDLSHDVCSAYTRLLAALRGPALRGPQPRMQLERADGTPLAHDGVIDLLHDQLSVWLNVTVGHYGDDVLARSRRVRHNLHRLAGSFSVALHHWFDALLHVGRLRQQANAASLKYVRRHLRKLRPWARHCPDNHAHRVAALEAELASLAGSPDAARLYNEAADLALRNGFTGDAAIIAHSCLRHCLGSGDPEAIRGAMERTHDLYTRWGATAMVRNLETSLPAFAWAREPAPVLPLDTGTLVKASQAISAELEMGAVAGRLLQQVMENAGARYGALLQEERGQLRLATEREGEPGLGEGRIGLPVEQTGLPHGLLRSVWLTQKSVVLADAAGSHAYGSCGRWQGASQVSVLCVPVVAAGETVGVLYLENELITGCFTPDREMLAHLLASQAAIAMANARLFQDLGAAHDGLRQANAQLEERVADRTRALEENHKRLRQLERQHAADEERQRIMSDLHDGLGSQLFVTLSRVERGELDGPQVAGDLRACIGDMRLALEAMSPDGEDFLQAWGSFRFRWDSQLRNAGLASHWDDSGTGESLPLASTTGLQVLRVAQEALTNVLKHARAQRVRIRLAATDNLLQLEIADNGIGPPPAGAGPGRGLGNMRVRAVRIGAAVTIEAAHPGTLVRLELPLR